MMNGYEYTGMDAILAGSFRAAIYCRLSKDDDLDGESASIANQRDMLESYCEKQGWEVVAVYQLCSSYLAMWVNRAQVLMLCVVSQMFKVLQILLFYLTTILVI